MAGHLRYTYDEDGSPESAAYSGTMISGLSGSDSWSPNVNEQVAFGAEVRSR
jgi:hypothetical protein